MKKISYQKMADTIIAKRKEKKLTQAQLADMTGIHRAMVSRLEGLDYIPSIDQLHYYCFISPKKVTFSMYSRSAANFPSQDSAFLPLV